MYAALDRPSNRGLPARALAFLCFVVPLAGCGGTPPQNPDPESVSWATYINHQAGFSLDVPDFYAVGEDQGGRSVLFRHDGYPVLSISFVDEHEGDSRGLWVGHEPVESIRLAGREGKRYVYRHYDGPSYMRTVSYVVKHRDRWLGLELRTESEKADPLQQRILESFRFSDEPAEEGLHEES